MAFRSSSAAAAGASSLSISKPAGVAEGDTLVLVMVGESVTNPTFNTPSGWTPAGDINSTDIGTDDVSSRVYTKIAGASEPSSYSLSLLDFGGGPVLAAAILAYDEEMTVDDIATGMSNSTTSIVCPSVTLSAAGTLINFMVKTGNFSSSAPTWGGSVTERVWQNNADGDIAGGDQSVSAGATGTRTHTVTSGGCHVWSIGLILAAAFESGGSDAAVEIEVAPTGGGVPSSYAGGSDASVEIEVGATGGGERVLPIPTATTWRGRINLSIEAGRRGNTVGEGEWEADGSGLTEWAEESTVDPPTWSGLEPEWSVLEDCSVLECQISRGRFAGTDRFGTGTAHVVLTFAVTAGAWSFRPTAPIALGDELRIRAAVDGAGFIPMFRGVIRRLTDRWVPGSDELELELELVDRFADIAAVNPPPLSSGVGAGELTSERLARLLTEGEVDPFYWDIATGVATVQATELERNLLDECQITAEAEPGPFYCARDGKITFRGRSWLTTEARSTTTQLVWSNDAGSNHMKYVSAFATGQHTDLLANQVTRARAGGSPITVRDNDSIIVYGLRTNRRLDMINDNDTDVTFAANAFLAQRSTRINQVGPLSAVLLPYLPFPMLENLVDIDLLDRHEVRWDDGSGAGELVEIMHVQSVQHSITAERWTVTVGVWQYS